MFIAIQNEAIIVIIIFFLGGGGGGGRQPSSTLIYFNLYFKLIKPKSKINDNGQKIVICFGSKASSYK